MNFEYSEYLPFVIAAIGLFAAMTLLMEKKFFSMVKTYWFYGRSFFSYISTFLMLGGIGLMIVSLMDARGPETRTKMSAPDLKTIILIDTSASMLAEDVKPSRLQKAVLIAKHFARKAVGHQLSVVVFAEIQKKIVPFTNDLDLIDARLDSLKAVRNQNGSSALSIAINESVQYFKETGQDRGNILVLTDGEETAGALDIKISKDYNVALVGIGTEQGGRIPLDDGRGFRFGYKKSEGKDVITKMDEKFFKKVVADLPSAQYWTSNSYSLPSEDILDFFTTEIKKGEMERDMVIRPVMMEWLVVPALILLILSYVFKAVRVFTLGLFLILGQVRAQETPEIPLEVAEKITKLQNGELNKLERLKLADDLQRAGATAEAVALYEENLSMGKIDSDVPPEAYLNYGTALLQKGEEQKGLTIYEDLSDKMDPKSPQSKAIKELIEKNVTSYFHEQAKQEQKKKEEEKKKSQDQQKSDSKQDGQGQQGDGKQQDQSGQGKEQKEKSNDGKGDQKKDDKEKDKEKNDKENDQDNKDEKDGDQDKDKNEREGEKESKKLPPKVPAKLKQLMSDDRQLQMNMIENGTRELNRRSKSRKNKDW